MGSEAAHDCRRWWHVRAERPGVITAEGSGRGAELEGPMGRETGPVRYEWKRGPEGGVAGSTQA